MLEDQMMLTFLDHLAQAKIYAGKTVVDELLTIRNRSKGRLILAERAEDFHGKVFFAAKIELLDKLLETADPTYKKEEECT